MTAYDLLVELSSRCVENMICISEQLITMHHCDKPQNSKEWEVRYMDG